LYSVFLKNTKTPTSVPSVLNMHPGANPAAALCCRAKQSSSVAHARQRYRRRLSGQYLCNHRIKD
jgi:hypothetical protein